MGKAPDVWPAHEPKDVFKDLCNADAIEERPTMEKVPGLQGTPDTSIEMRDGMNRS